VIELLPINPSVDWQQSPGYLQFYGAHILEVADTVNLSIPTLVKKSAVYTKKLAIVVKKYEAFVVLIFKSSTSLLICESTYLEIFS